MFRKLREQGDGGSGDAAVAKPASPEAPTPEPTTPAAPAEKGGGEKDSTPSVTDLQAQITKLQKTVGDQGNQIGGYKKSESTLKTELENHRAFAKSLQDNPSTTLQSLANVTGHKLVAPSGADPNVIGDPTADQGAGVAQYIQDLVGKTLTENMVPVNAMMGTMHEQHLATKYGDAWDELTQVRSSNLTRIQANQVPAVELAHIMSEYQRFPQTISAAKQDGREEYRAELEKKAQEHKADPSGHEPGKPPKREQTAVTAASQLENEW